ncbi:hypothetical protein NUU61_003081 [Penicillium alfredii]|uniref:Uncharacterized protein n=1 Tax=Penicillium alfredii TaxID=1506179 RepID=A0A9W9KGJ4_9EURO|nr:uncharacterized protein NUU61_003081 [Penicillium alfredii]KAJ5105734.1 hypothetical protein NUU61_003081 [Penicillium alfredii]
MWKILLSHGPRAILPSSTGAGRTAARTIYATPPRHQAQNPHHNAKDRETLNPERTEVTKSGTDSEIAHHASAYDPSTTAPETELAETEEEHHREGKSGNPLNMSPANKDVSAWRGPKEEGPVRNAEKASPSARGTPKKNRTVHVKEDGTHVAYR